MAVRARNNEWLRRIEFPIPTIKMTTPVPTITTNPVVQPKGGTSVPQNTAQTIQKKGAGTFSTKRCPNGHVCTPQAKKCPTCRVPCLSMSKTAIRVRLMRLQKKAGTYKPKKRGRKRSSPSSTSPGASSASNGASSKPKKKIKTSKKKTSPSVPGRPEYLKRLNLRSGAIAKIGDQVVTLTSVSLTKISFQYQDGSSGTTSKLKDIRALRVVFLNEHNNHVQMDAATSWTILDAYASKKPSVSYSCGSQNYDLKFASNWKGDQTNTNTNVVRPVLLSVFMKTVPIPEVFTKQKPVPLNTLPACAQKIFHKHAFLKKGKIYDLQPFLGGDRIVAITQTIQKERGNPHGLTWCFHGTTVDSAQKIAMGGFQNAGTANAKCYGQGVYLSKDANYSKTYSCPNKHKQRVMFMCHALLGKRESSGSGVTMLSSHSVRSGGQSSGDLIMKPWVYTHTDINIAYAIVF